MDPGSLIGLLVAAVIGALVAFDASALRNEEVAANGQSSIIPVLWGFAVFLLLIVFLPWYLIMRSSHKRRLLTRCPYCASTINRDARVCPFCKREVAPAVPFPAAPPMPPLPEVAVPSGWIADPTSRHELRYWDGHQWTQHVSDSGVQSIEEVGA